MSAKERLEKRRSWRSKNRRIKTEQHDIDTLKMYANFADARFPWFFEEFRLRYPSQDSVAKRLKAIYEDVYTKDMARYSPEVQEALKKQVWTWNA